MPLDDAGQPQNLQNSENNDKKHRVYKQLSRLLFLPAFVCDVCCLSVEAEGNETETRHYYLKSVLIDGFQSPEVRSTNHLSVF